MAMEAAARSQSHDAIGMNQQLCDYDREQLSPGVKQMNCSLMRLATMMKQDGPAPSCRT